MHRNKFSLIRLLLLKVCRTYIEIVGSFLGQNSEIVVWEADIVVLDSDIVVWVVEYFLEPEADISLGFEWSLGVEGSPQRGKKAQDPEEEFLLLQNDRFCISKWQLGHYPLFPLNSSRLLHPPCFPVNKYRAHYFCKMMRIRKHT